jgi:hypothetical protein
MTIDLYSLLTRALGLDPQACAGKVIVVTGAGRGIGLQIARAFALLGGKVVLAELSEQGQAAERLICAEGGDAFFVQTDVADAEAVARLAYVSPRSRRGWWILPAFAAWPKGWRFAWAYRLSSFLASRSMPLMMA